MIKPRCDFCGKELRTFGALLFSPPRGKKVVKMHACRRCYRILLRLVGKI